MSIFVVFRNDDPAGVSDAGHEERILEMFDRRGIRQTHGVIPLCVADDTHDPAGTSYVPLADNPRMVDLLRRAAAAGSEIALHGYTHRTNPRSLPRRREYFEFKALSADEAHDRVARGLDVVQDVLGVRPETFIPPWNRIDAASIEGCARAGIRIVSAGPFLEEAHRILHLGTDTTVPQLPSRLESAAGSGRDIFIRVLYHSRTTRTREEIAALDRALAAVASMPECQALTIRDTVERHRDAVRLVNDAARNIVPPHEVPGTARARVSVYRKLRLPFGSAAQLDAEQRGAEAEYRTGAYESAAARTVAIDRLSARLLTRSRSVVAAAAAVAAPLAAWALGFLLPPAAVYGAGALAAVGAGVGGWWKGTSPDTRREMTTAAGFAGAGAAAGLLITQWAGLW